MIVARLLGRAALIWLAILVLANLNGAVREFLLRPRLGVGAARVTSTLLLVGVVALTTWLTIRWIGPARTREGIAIGVLWVALTLAFELLVGHYVFHETWDDLFADYDVTAGRIWPLVLFVTFASPEICRRLQS